MGEITPYQAATIFDLIKALYQIDFETISKKLGIKKFEINNYKKGQKKMHENFLNHILSIFPRLKLYVDQEGLIDEFTKEEVENMVDEQSIEYTTDVGQALKIALKNQETILSIQEQMAKLMERIQAKNEGHLV